MSQFRPLVLDRPRRPMRFWGLLLLPLSCAGAVGGDPQEGVDTPLGPNQGAPEKSVGNAKPIADVPGPAPHIDPNKPIPPILAQGVGPLPLTRLSRLELRNTWRDLLGDTKIAADDLPADATTSSGFVSGGTLATNDARRMLDVTEALGSRILPKIGSLARCSVGQAEAECATAFLRTFSRRAYRRPATDLELARLRGLYDKARVELKLDFPNAVRLLVQAITQSPAFLYHWELGAQGPKVEGKIVRLTPHETASRLSFLLWRSMPDDILGDEADKGGLRSPEQVEAQARRLLADKRARDAVGDFHTQWLHVGDLDGVVKDKTVYPLFTPAMADDMQAELETFSANALVGEGKGSFAELLTAPYAFANEALGRIYGAKVQGAELRRVGLDAGQRAGILTQTAFLTRHASSVGSHPVKRGDVIAKQLLCIELPAPPANIPAPKAPALGLTTRERFAEHGQNACATGCHAIIDPLGFAFESYDGVGGFRFMEGTKPVDSTGKVALPGGETLAFTSGVDLAGKLARNSQVAECMTKQWARYGLGRRETAEEEGSLRQVKEAFSKTNLDVRELLVALVKTPSFGYRSVSEGEVSP